MGLTIKRIYDPPLPDDGFRVLVDRLWPRGVSRQNAKLDLWLKEIAPSNELRQWFSHDPEKFREFSARYENELSKNPAADKLKQLIKDHSVVTLLYGTRDPKINHAAVLKKLLER